VDWGREAGGCGRPPITDCGEVSRSAMVIGSEIVVETPGLDTKRSWILFKSKSLKFPAGCNIIFDISFLTDTWCESGSIGKSKLYEPMVFD
jgi:hypothetical protein